MVSLRLHGSLCDVGGQFLSTEDLLDGLADLRVLVEAFLHAGFHFSGNGSATSRGVDHVGVDAGDAEICGADSVTGNIARVVVAHLLVGTHEETHESGFHGLGALLTGGRDAIPLVHDVVVEVCALSILGVVEPSSGGKVAHLRAGLSHPASIDGGDGHAAEREHLLVALHGGPVSELDIALGEGHAAVCQHHLGGLGSSVEREVLDFDGALATGVRSGGVG